MKRRCAAGWLVLVFAMGALAPVAHTKVIHRERSLYSTILVTEEYNRICLQFRLRAFQRNQSCINKRDKQSMVFAYTRMMMTALLFNAEPRHVLVVGLGGGTLPSALHTLYADAQIDSVEIDPAVVTVASRYFGFTPSKRLRVHTIDGRIFTKRALGRNQRYDLILLDAFNGDYIPEHLMTAEYLEENKALLTPNGVLLANTFAISDLYDHESATYASVFGEFINFRLPETSNRVIIARKDDRPWPDQKILKERAKILAPMLKRYDVPIRRYVKRLTTDVDWRHDARILTDRYSPANLLQGH